MKKLFFTISMLLLLFSCKRDHFNWDNVNETVITAFTFLTNPPLTYIVTLCTLTNTIYCW